MWALRRASILLKNQRLSTAPAIIYGGKLEMVSCYPENYSTGFIESQEKLSDDMLSAARFYSTYPHLSKSYCRVRTFSSQAGAKSSGEEDGDLEDGFSELETPHVNNQATPTESDEESISESEFSEEDAGTDMHNELELLDTETGAKEKIPSKPKGTPAIVRAILQSPDSSVRDILDKWVKEGNEVSRADASLILFSLRKRRMYVKALQLSEWLEKRDDFEFLDSNYASRVDLIAKVRGIIRAEEYIQRIPESFRGELVYRTLLANCVAANELKKSEQLFNKMKNLGFPVTCFACNQLLLLYKRVDKKKIADVLLLMEKENIKPSTFTYQILIDVKGKINDIAGMEQILETMKAEGVEPNTQIRASLARHYVAAGQKDKAEAVLKELEGDDITKNHFAVQILLPIYASLGKEDEVARIWKTCESNPWLADCLAAIEAWGQLKKIENAEAAFERIVEKTKTPNAKHFTALLSVYADHKMLAKGKDLVRRMAESGCKVGPVTWDVIVKLYVAAGEVEKADSVLEKAAKQRKGKPMFNSYLVILDQYAKRRDIHNAEKIFLKMKQMGYESRARMYQSLLQAYIHAKTPAYGFSDRMKADNIFPNNVLASQLARVNAFKKTPVSELLE